MAAWEIDRFERHADGFWMVFIRAKDELIVADNRLGSWTLLADVNADRASDSATRREVLPNVAKAVQERLRAQLDADGDLPARRQVKRTR